MTTPIAMEKAYQHGGWQQFLRTELQLAEKSARTPGSVWQIAYDRMPNFELARGYARLGETTRAIASLEAAYRNREGNLVCINVEPLFDTLRSDPRFRDLVRRVGMSP